MTESLAMAGAAEEPLDRRIVAELPALRAYLRRLVRGSEVDDLAQEVVARALRYRASFDAQRALGPWLRATALRTILDHRAKLGRAPERFDERDAVAESAPERLDASDALERVLRRLSEVEREVLERFHGRGESLAEIAQRLDMPEGTVKSHLHRARKKLAEERP